MVDRNAGLSRVRSGKWPKPTIVPATAITHKRKRFVQAKSPRVNGHPEKRFAHPGRSCFPSQLKTNCLFENWLIDILSIHE
jgi:hypothetical protein